MIGEEFTEYDILIVGAGVAGCIAAMSLRHDFRIVLLEKGNKPPDYPQETLIPSAGRIFRELNMQEWLGSEKCRQTYRVSDGAVSYWENDRPFYSDALLNPEGGSFLLDKKAFLDELRSLTGGFSFPFAQGTIRSVQRDGGYWKVETDIENGQSRKYRVKQLIDASGRAAVIPAKLGFKRTILDKLICITATVDYASGDLLCRTFSDKNGWWFLCPTSEQRLQISYYTDADPEGRKLTKAVNFHSFLQEDHLWKKELSVESLSNLIFSGSRAANTSRLDNFCGPGWIAIGDAAMCFDPLSSQGSYKAMATAMELFHLLKQHNFIRSENEADETLFQDRFTEKMERIWSHYREHHSYYYAAANREGAFWERRV